LAFDDGTFDDALLFLYLFTCNLKKKLKTDEQLGIELIPNALHKVSTLSFS